jgi:hypothetical protein
MPRRKGSASTATAIRQVRRQAGAVLAKLRKDIRVAAISKKPFSERITNCRLGDWLSR